MCVKMTTAAGFNSLLTPRTIMHHWANLSYAPWFPNKRRVFLHSHHALATSVTGSKKLNFLIFCNGWHCCCWTEINAYLFQHRIQVGPDHPPDIMFRIHTYLCHYWQEQEKKRRRRKKTKLVTCPCRHLFPQQLAGQGIYVTWTPF